MDSAYNPARGIFWMIVTGLCFVCVTALVKLIGPRIPAAEQAFLRYALGIVFLIPMLPAIQRAHLSRRLWTIFTLRGVVHTLGVICWFFAMTRIPLAEVTALNYLVPVFVTVLAIFVLGEKVALRRFLAIFAALIGAGLILRPGFRELDLGHLTMLGTATCFAGSYLAAKITSGEVSATVVVGMLSITVTLGLAPFAYVVWVPPSLHDLVILFGVASFATAGHYTMTLAFAAAPVSVTQPATFLQLVWAVSIGALFFGEPVDPWVIAGGTVIVGAIVFISWREARLKRVVTPSTPETK